MPPLAFGLVVWRRHGAVGLCATGVDEAKFAGTPDVSALNDLGAWFGEQKNYSCAAQVFATSLQMDPKQKDMPHVAFMFGASLYHVGDTKEAIAALREAENLATGSSSFI